MDRFTVVLSVVVAGLVALGVAVAAFTGGRSTPDESTPRGIVVAYLQAIRTGEPDRAWGYLTSPLKQRFPRDRFVQQTGFSSGSRGRVEVGDATITGDSARVPVIYQRGGGLFDGSYAETVVTLLERENGQWRISSPPEPYIPTEIPVKG